MSTVFELVIDLAEQGEDQEATGIVTKGAYTPKDLNSDSNTGWSIVDGAKFVTELVEMDFSKEDTQCNPRVLLQKVNDKMLTCKTTPDNSDAICFVMIIEDFKVSNFGHIFSETGSQQMLNIWSFARLSYCFDAL